MIESVNDQAIRVLSMVSAINDSVSNEDPERHIIRNLKRAASDILSKAFYQAEDLALLAKDVTATFENMQQKEPSKMTFLFHRLDEGKEFFYPLDLPNEAEVLPNVRANPGTMKVTTPDWRVVWSLE